MGTGRPREVRRIEDRSLLEAGLHPVREVVRGVRGERDRLDAHRTVRRPLHRERAVRELEILLGDLELVRDDRSEPSR